MRDLYKSGFLTKGPQTPKEFLGKIHGNYEIKVRKIIFIFKTAKWNI